jgi:hypothetical protein
VQKNKKKSNRRTDGRTDGQTDGQTDGKTDDSAHLKLFFQISKLQCVVQTCSAKSNVVFKFFQWLVSVETHLELKDTVICDA